MNGSVPFAPRRFWYGGDYNPEQWPESVWEEDIRLMKEAGVTCVSLGIFAWAALEPADGEYDFAWMDRIIAMLHEADVSVCLATPTAALPRWLTAKHPDTLTVNERGDLRPHGARHRICPTSNALRGYVERINTRLADRYHAHPAVVAWHISNEVQPHCWCENCRVAFQAHLREKYGDIDTLNRQWWARFWSHRYFSFDQVDLPWPAAGGGTNALQLDWRRFQHAALAHFVRWEIETLRKAGATQPATANLMWSHPLCENQVMADQIDFISWDSYPELPDPLYKEAVWHSYFRGLKDGAPWVMLEQSVSSTNWHGHARLKPPGQYRRESWRAIAHGSEGAMCFQWRQSRGAGEKFHSAMVPHIGAERSRTFREVAELGAELKRLGPRIAGSRVRKAKIGVLRNTESDWAFRLSSGPGADKPVPELFRFHAGAIGRAGYAFDVLRIDGDWSDYDMLIVPALYMTHTLQFATTGGGADVADRLTRFVEAGGTVLTTFLTGYVNENDLVHERYAPGPLRRLLGLSIEELDNHPAGEATNQIALDADALPGLDGPLECDRYFELPLLEGAEAIGRYTSNFYADRPALTRHRVGRGVAYHLASWLTETGFMALVRSLARHHGIAPVLPAADDGVEAVERVSENGHWLFVMNHTGERRRATLPGGTWTDALTGEQFSGAFALPPQAVFVLEPSA